MSFKEEEIHQQFGWKPLGTENIDFSKKIVCKKIPYQNKH